MKKEEAISLAETIWWKDVDYHDRAKFQLFEEKLCMPFSIFHEAIEKALGRPVWTHEFGSVGIEGLRAEFLGDKPPPLFDEIIGLIPAEKRIIITGGRQ